MSHDYAYDDLLVSYAELGVARGRSIFVASDLTRLMRFQTPGRQKLLEAHFDALFELLGHNGTLFVPTASMDLCNTDLVFDLAATPSREMGAFSEFVRTRKRAVRSFHPFWSVAGIGPAAAELLSDVSPHAYGWGSVFQRFVEHDVLGVNIGKPPQLAMPVIHHIETVIGVPYRYTKEFIHPVRRADGVRREQFYLSVVYQGSDIVRDRNRRIMENFATAGTLRETALGRGRAWSFSHREFFDVTTALMRHDIYAWLARPPVERPYQR